MQMVFRYYQLDIAAVGRLQQSPSVWLFLWGFGDICINVHNYRFRVYLQQE